MERDFIVPNPLISRHKPVFTSAASEPAWLALAVGPGAKRVLVSWAASGTDYGDVRAGAPAAYRIESSASSSNGSDGVWRVEVDVSDNAARARAHEFEFDGQSWVRWVLTAAPRESPGLKIEAVDVHDATDGTDDTWLFLGDPSAGAAFGRSPAQFTSFARHINEQYPAYFPAVIDASITGESTTAAIERLDRVLAHHPDFRHVAIAYGAHDSAGGLLRAAQFRDNLRSIIQRLVARGRNPVLGPLPLAPTAELQEHQRAIEELRREHDLLPAGALSTYWADATDCLYAPH